VVELKIAVRTALHALTLISTPDEDLHVVRDGLSLGGHVSEREQGFGPLDLPLALQVLSLDGCTTYGSEVSSGIPLCLSRKSVYDGSSPYVGARLAGLIGLPINQRSQREPTIFGEFDLGWR
jgi:hypothetical protein